MSRINVFTEIIENRQSPPNTSSFNDIVVDPTTIRLQETFINVTGVLYSPIDGTGGIEDSNGGLVNGTNFENLNVSSINSAGGLGGGGIRMRKEDLLLRICNDAPEYSNSVCVIVGKVQTDRCLLNLIRTIAIETSLNVTSPMNEGAGNSSKLFNNIKGPFSVQILAPFDKGTLSHNLFIGEDIAAEPEELQKIHNITYVQLRLGTRMIFVLVVNHLTPACVALLQSTYHRHAIVQIDCQNITAPKAPEEKIDEVFNGKNGTEYASVIHDLYHIDAAAEANFGPLSLISAGTGGLPSFTPSSALGKTLATTSSTGPNGSVGGPIASHPSSASGTSLTETFKELNALCSGLARSGTEATRLKELVAIVSGKKAAEDYQRKHNFDSKELLKRMRKEQLQLVMEFQAKEKRWQNELKEVYESNLKLRRNVEELKTRLYNNNDDSNHSFDVNYNNN